MQMCASLTVGCWPQSLQKMFLRKKGRNQLIQKTRIPLPIPLPLPSHLQKVKLNMREAEEGNTRGGQKLNILKRDERKQAVQKSQEINILQAPKVTLRGVIPVKKGQSIQMLKGKSLWSAPKRFLQCLRTDFY